MYRVEWLNDNGDTCVKSGFETSEEAHEWIKKHHFKKFAFPMVFYDEEQKYVFHQGRSDYMFPTITSEKQKEFEENCIRNNIASGESQCNVPCICGYYGRACRQMNDKADRFLCIGCALAEFIKGN